MEKCESPYLLQTLESAQLVAASPLGSGMGWDVHGIFTAVPLMMHKLWEASAPQFPPRANCVYHHFPGLFETEIPYIHVFMQHLAHLVLELCGRAVTKSSLKDDEEGQCGCDHICAAGKVFLVNQHLLSVALYDFSALHILLKCMSDLFRISLYPGSDES